AAMSSTVRVSSLRQRARASVKIFSAVVGSNPNPLFAGAVRPFTPCERWQLFSRGPSSCSASIHEVDDRRRLAGDERGDDLAAFDFCIDHGQDSQAVLVPVLFRFKLVAGHSLNKPLPKVGSTRPPRYGRIMTICSLPRLTN